MDVDKTLLLCDRCDHLIDVKFEPDYMLDGEYVCVMCRGQDDG